MRHCVQFAMTYPDRTEGLCKPIDFTLPMQLTFDKADEDTFSLLKLARFAAEKGGTYTTVLNAANESAVRLFLQKNISFLQLFDVVEETVCAHKGKKTVEIDEILELDDEIKKEVFEKYRN